MSNGEHRWSIIRKAIIERDGACVWCAATSTLTVDHILPRDWRGSTNGHDNLRTLCSRCHQKKESIEKYLTKKVMLEHITVAEAKSAVVLWNLHSPRKWWLLDKD